MEHRGYRTNRGSTLGGIEATRNFERAMAWRLHDEKSVVVTSNKELSGHIEELGNLPAADQAKYLGIIHNPGRKRKRGLRDTRALKTIPVWAKIAALNIPKAKRRLMAAAAGTAKACYGAAVNRTTQGGEPRCAPRR